MGSLKLTTASSGSVILSAANTASDTTITVPAVTGTMITTASTFSGTGPAFSAVRTTNQSITANTWTKYQANIEEFDTNSCYDNSTNYRFTPNVAGYYQVNGRFGIVSTDTRVICSIYKNGSDFKRGNDSGSANSAAPVVSALVYLNGSTDYIEFYVYSGVTQNVYGTVYEGYFQASLVRAA